LDGKILPSGGITAFSSGNFNHVPIMSGMVQDEGNFNIGITEYFSGPPRTPITAANFEASIQATYSGNSGPGGTPPAYPAGTVQAVMNQYPLSAYSSPQLALDAVTTDPLSCRSRYASQVLASKVSVYAYEFQDRTTPYYFPKMPGFQPLAAHTSDIQYLFPLFHGGPNGVVHQLNAKQSQLSDELVAAWTNFAWTGNPNGNGNSPWPVYKGKANAASFLAENVPVLTTMTDAQFSAEHKCDFWQKLLTYN
jgi:para-nitrobenzyl esterase